MARAGLGDIHDRDITASEAKVKKPGTEGIVKMGMGDGGCRITAACVDGTSFLRACGERSTLLERGKCPAAYLTCDAAADVPHEAYFVLVLPGERDCCKLLL